MSNRISIIESDSLVRRSIDVLAMTLGYETTTIDSIDRMIDEYDPQQPGCIIIGVAGNGVSEIETLGRFISDNPTCRIVLMTDGCDVSTAVRAMRLGFADVLEHPFSYQQLKTAIETAVRENRSRIDSDRKKLPDSICSLLTQQEEDIVALLLEGAATKEIAAKLDLSIRTIHYRKNAIFTKIGANSWSHAMQLLTRPKMPQTV